MFIWVFKEPSFMGMQLNYEQVIVQRSCWLMIGSGFILPFTYWGLSHVVNGNAMNKLIQDHRGSSLFPRKFLDKLVNGYPLVI